MWAPAFSFSPGAATITATAVAASNAAATAQAAVDSLASYKAQISTCLAYSTDGYDEFRACANSPGFCGGPGNITCGTGFECTNFATTPTPTDAPSGYCTAFLTAEQTCAKGGCAYTLNEVCYLNSAVPPFAYSSCGAYICTSNEDCGTAEECVSAQDPTPGSPVAFPIGVKTCMAK